MSHTPQEGWRSFWALIVLQIQNAFNDKAAQFLLIPLGTWIVLSGVEVSKVEWLVHIKYILALVIVFPFVLFSPLAGWFSDAFSKTTIIRIAVFLQLGILLWISFAVYYHYIWLALAGFFVLSMQSVLLSPAKRGIIKELVGSRGLGLASGIMETSSTLAICAGQIIIGYWFTKRCYNGANGWDAALVPLCFLGIASLLPIGLSLCITKMPRHSQRAFSPRLFWEHFSQLKHIFYKKPLRISAIGASFFWGYAGYLNLAAISIAERNTVGGKDFAAQSSTLMLAASLGIIVGGLIASLLCRRSLRMELIPLGGLGMLLGCVGLACVPGDSVIFKSFLLLAGMGGALFLVPINAKLQDLCPSSQRGEILAGLNLMDCLTGLLAALIQLGLVLLGVSLSAQFLGLACISCFVTCYVSSLLPTSLPRLLGLPLVRAWYGIETVGKEHIPKGRKGFIIVANHVSYVDAFVLTAAFGLRLRFLMSFIYMRMPLIGWCARCFGTIGIAPNKAKDGIKDALKALEDGDIICLFPEGKLTRTGKMIALQKGYLLLAKKAQVPLLPVGSSGLWGSVFSYAGGRFFWKKPRLHRKVTLRVGPAYVGEYPSPERLLLKLRELSEE